MPCDSSGATTAPAIGAVVLDCEEAVDVVDIAVVDVEETADSLDCTDLVYSLEAPPVRVRCSGPSVSTFHLHLNQFRFLLRIPEKFSENRIVGLLSIIVELPSYLADFAVLETLAPHHQKGGKYHILQIFGVPKPDN